MESHGFPWFVWFWSLSRGLGCFGIQIANFESSDEVPALWFMALRYLIGLGGFAPCPLVLDVFGAQRELISRVPRGPCLVF